MDNQNGIVLEKITNILRNLETVRDNLQRILMNGSVWYCTKMYAHQNVLSYEIRRLPAGHVTPTGYELHDAERQLLVV